MHQRNLSNGVAQSPEAPLGRVLRVVVDVNHPGHVHFFKNFIWEMQQRGHEVVVTASYKDVVKDLLDQYGLPHINLGTYGHSLLTKLLRTPLMSIKMWRAIRRIRPDVVVGITSVRGAHAASLLKCCRCFVFDDTEHATEQIRLYLPFVDRAYTPSCFRANLGVKQHRYPGYHELAYLHPSRFSPDSAVLEKAGVDIRSPYFVVRFVSWESTHDIGHHGMSIAGKRKLVKTLARHGRVIISSEAQLPDEFEPFRLPIRPCDIHHLLAYAQLCVGEGATMASEAAVLGTPSIYTNPLGAGTIDDQQSYGLLRHVPREEEAIELAEQFAKNENARCEFSRRRDIMLADKIDVTGWMVETIESIGISQAVVRQAVVPQTVIRKAA